MYSLVCVNLRCTCKVQQNARINKHSLTFLSLIFGACEEWQLYWDIGFSFEQVLKRALSDSRETFVFHFFFGSGFGVGVEFWIKASLFLWEALIFGVLLMFRFVLLSSRYL